MKPQVSQHIAESCQVTEIGLTEPGLQADSTVGRNATCDGHNMVA
jgi:hypothetical protein